MKRRRTIEGQLDRVPLRWTPFAGMAIHGWPVATIVRGATVMREDEVLGTPIAASPVSARNRRRLPLSPRLRGRGRVRGLGDWPHLFD